MTKFEGKPAGPDRIVGIRDMDELSLKHKFSDKTLNEQTRLDYERDMSANEKVVMTEILSRLPDFLIEYGATEQRFILPEQIHIIDEKDIASDYVKKAAERGVGGRFFATKGRIEIFVANDDLLSFADTLVHELMHYNAFMSAQFVYFQNGVVNPGILNRRTGLSMRVEDSDTKYNFESLDEAVTEEMAIRFMKRFFSEIEILKDSFVSKYGASINDNASDELSKVNTDQNYTPHSYIIERAQLLVLIRYLHSKNSDKFQSEDEIFKLFSSAMLNGDLLPLARLIERTLGKGSFRKIGQSSVLEDPIKLWDTLEMLIRKANGEISE